MESMRPRVYSVRGPEIPKKYGGNAFSPQPSKCEIPEKKRHFFAFSESSRRRPVDSRIDDSAAERGRGRQLHNAYNSCSIAV